MRGMRRAVEAARARQTAAAASPWGRPGLVRQQEEEIGYNRDLGRRADAGYMGFADDFDASKQLDTWARGAYANVSEGSTDQLRDLEGQSVSQGRLDTGFYDEDRGEVIEENME